MDLKLKFQQRTNNSKRSCSVFYVEKDSGQEESPTTSLSPDEEIPVIKEQECLPIVAVELDDEATTPIGFGEPAIRPSELALFEDRPPVAPPRTKKDSTVANQKRDNRLLSVPNIKYHNQRPPGQGFSPFGRKKSKCTKQHDFDFKNYKNMINLVESSISTNISNTHYYLLHIIMLI